MSEMTSGLVERAAAQSGKPTVRRTVVVGRYGHEIALLPAYPRKNTL